MGSNGIGRIPDLKDNTDEMDHLVKESVKYKSKNKQEETKVECTENFVAIKTKLVNYRYRRKNSGKKHRNIFDKSIKENYPL